MANGHFFVRVTNLNVSSMINIVEVGNRQVIVLLRRVNSGATARH